MKFPNTERFVVDLGSACAPVFGAGVQAVQVTINPINYHTGFQGVDPVTGENFELNTCGGRSEMYSGVTNEGLFRRALL